MYRSLDRHKDHIIDKLQFIATWHLLIHTLKIDRHAESAMHDAYS